MRYGEPNLLTVLKQLKKYIDRLDKLYKKLYRGAELRINKEKDAQRHQERAEAASTAREAREFLGK